MQTLMRMNMQRMSEEKSGRTAYANTVAVYQERKNQQDLCLFPTQDWALPQSLRHAYCDKKKEQSHVIFPTTTLIFYGLALLAGFTFTLVFCHNSLWRILSLTLTFTLSISNSVFKTELLDLATFISHTCISSSLFDRHHRAPHSASILGNIRQPAETALLSP